MEAGFHSADEAEAASNWNISTFSDYDAFIFYLISTIKKGEEFSLSALSRRLGEDLNKMSSDLSRAIREYIGCYRYSDCFSGSSLESFLNRVPLEKMGKWNAKSEIFKKN